jgi:hypothetical protein
MIEDNKYSTRLPREEKGKENDGRRIREVPGNLSWNGHRRTNLTLHDANDEKISIVLSAQLINILFSQKYIITAKPYRLNRHQLK